MEVHEENDQFFRIESGKGLVFPWILLMKGKAIIDGNEYILEDGVAVVIPSGSKHNVINTSATDDLQVTTTWWWR